MLLMKRSSGQKKQFPCKINADGKTVGSLEIKTDEVTRES